MAAGNRNTKGNATDFVRHFGVKMAGLAYCATKKSGFVTTDKKDVTCKKCIKLLNKITQ